MASDSIYAGAVTAYETGVVTGEERGRIRSG